MPNSTCRSPAREVGSTTSLEYTPAPDTDSTWTPLGDEATATHIDSRPGDLEYQIRFGKEIEAFLSDLEHRAAQNTNVYLKDGVTLNPARAPFVSLPVGLSVKRDTPNESKTGESEPFWKWAILLQRWIHEDKDTGIFVIYPKQLMG